MANKKTLPSIKLRFEVTDVNTVGKTILMEAFHGDLKYLLMIDADMDAEFLDVSVPGDKYDVVLKNAVKLTAKKVTKNQKAAGITSVTTVVVKGATCPGSGAVANKKDLFRAKTPYGHGVNKVKCPDCGKEMAVNGGYNGQPYTIRKHNA